MAVCSCLFTVYFQEPYIWPQIHSFIFKCRTNIGSKCSIENDEHSLSLIDVLDSIGTQKNPDFENNEPINDLIEARRLFFI